MTRNPDQPQPAKAPRSRRRSILLGTLLTVLVVGLLGIATLAVAYARTDIPSPNELANAQSSILFYADGHTELDRFSERNRESVPLAKVPDHVQKAMLAAEDRSFYDNNGISPTGIARALWTNLRGGATQGGSTITQQYVKNYFLTQDQTLSRKLREALISVKIDREQSKDTTLADYLNTIYYGRGAYGIQTAAHAYFGKDVSDLTVSEGAFLASVIRAPSLYDPAEGKQALANAKARFDYVINGMVSQGWLSPAEQAKARFPTIDKPTKRGHAGPTGFITDDVRAELKGKLKLSDADLDRGGLRITTTIDKSAQDAAEASVKKNMPTGKNTDHLRVGLTAIRPGDGAVVAMYGGADYAASQFNTATDAHLQAGSTFKPFTLIAALQGDVSTHDRYPGQSPQFFPEFVGQGNPSGKVTNFQNEQFGRIDLRTALAHSVNTVFARLNIDIGPQKTMDAAIAAGLPQNTPGLEANPANVLGTASPRVIDMAGAYATIAAQGARATPYLVAKVTSQSSAINYTAHKQVQAVFDKDVMADVTDAMAQVVEQGSGAIARELGRPAAGKTGTSSANLSVWFDGFTPQLAAAVGMYNDVDGTPKPMQDIGGFAGLTGGTYPTRIWTDFMIGALKGEPVEQLPQRVGVNDDKTPATAPMSSATQEATTSEPTTPPSTSSSPSSSATETSPSSSAPVSPPPSTPPAPTASTPSASSTPSKARTGTHTKTKGVGASTSGALVGAP